MESGIYLNERVWSSPLVGYNKKQNRRVVDLLEETQLDHDIRSSVAITKLLLGRDILKKKKKMNNKKEKCDLLKIFFLWIFKLSCLVIVYTASFLVQKHSKSVLWRNFVYKQVFHAFCISPMGTGWSTLNRECYCTL